MCGGEVFELETLRLGTFSADKWPTPTGATGGNTIKEAMPATLCLLGNMRPDF